ncbi:MAG TPA: alkaline phosphatase family protein [Kofleriaceae bacterium]|nr:alkaline phosphatase family protein [Kofleriaceae bacterium]
MFTIVMENKSRNQIIGNNDAPFINSLLGKGALAAGYHDPYIHPSEPNYIWMIAGENFGILDDDDPGEHHIASTSHIADQIEAAGLTWRSYQESMGAPCGLTSHGTYAAKHDPFVYFNDITGWDGHTYHPSTRCTDHVVDYGQLAADLAAGSVPSYVFITPNMDNDMHDGSIARGDGWLSREIPNILASPSFINGGVLFLLWDEGGGLIDKEDDPPFIALSPNGKQGFVSKTDYDTSSYLKTVQSLLGLESLPCDADPSSVSTMDDLFIQQMPAPHAVAPDPVLSL